MMAFNMDIKKWQRLGVQRCVETQICKREVEDIDHVLSCRDRDSHTARCGLDVIGQLARGFHNLRGKLADLLLDY